MGFETIIQLYVAFFIVVTLHEIGHIPKRIHFKLGFIPSAWAEQGAWREGGLLVNAALFTSVWYLQPENVFLQYIGLLAWAHFILYAILGAIIPEPKESQVNIRTYVFDDVNNSLWYIWIPVGIIAFMKFSPYYLPILKGVIPW